MRRQSRLTRVRVYASSHGPTLPHLFRPTERENTEDRAYSGLLSLFARLCRTYSLLPPPPPGARVIAVPAFRRRPRSARGSRPVTASTP